MAESWSPYVFIFNLYLIKVGEIVIWVVMEQKFSSKKCLGINDFVTIRIKICNVTNTDWPIMKKKIIFVCKQNFLIWTKRKLRILIHGLHYRSHHLGWLTLESLVAKKKWKKG